MDVPTTNTDVVSGLHTTTGETQYNTMDPLIDPDCEIIDFCEDDFVKDATGLTSLPSSSDTKDVVIKEVPHRTLDLGDDEIIDDLFGAPEEVANLPPMINKYKNEELSMSRQLDKLAKALSYRNKVLASSFGDAKESFQNYFDGGVDLEALVADLKYYGVTDQEIEQLGNIQITPPELIQNLISSQRMEDNTYKKNLMNSKMEKYVGAVALQRGYRADPNLGESDSGYSEIPKGEMNTGRRLSPDTKKAPSQQSFRFSGEKETVTQIQNMLGFTGDDADGLWGPNTDKFWNAKMQEAASHSTGDAVRTWNNAKMPDAQLKGSISNAATAKTVLSDALSSIAAAAGNVTTQPVPGTTTPEAISYKDLPTNAQPTVENVSEVLRNIVSGNSKINTRDMGISQERMKHLTSRYIKDIVKSDSNNDGAEPIQDPYAHVANRIVQYFGTSMEAALSQILSKHPDFTDKLQGYLNSQVWNALRSTWAQVKDATFKKDPTPKSQIRRNKKVERQNKRWNKKVSKSARDFFLENIKTALKNK